MNAVLRRRTLLFAVPPAALLLMLLPAGNRRGPSSSDPARPDLSSTDEVSLREVVERRVPAPSAGSTLLRRTMKVIDAGGRPLAAKVRVAFSLDGFQKLDTMEVEPDASGRLPLDLDPSAWVVLSIQAPGHSPRWQPPVTWGQLRDEDLQFELADAVAVAGASRWSDGRPMSAMRLSFRPQWNPGEFAGQVASRLKIVDEEVTTDSTGGFTCASLRPGAYRVTFPDHPKWPALEVSSAELARGSLALRANWNAR